MYSLRVYNYSSKLNFSLVCPFKFVGREKRLKGSSLREYAKKTSTLISINFTPFKDIMGSFHGEVCTPCEEEREWGERGSKKKLVLESRRRSPGGGEVDGEDGEGERVWYETSFPIGAWKWNLPPYKEIVTDQPTDQQTGSKGRFTSIKEKKVGKGEDER